MNRCALLVLTGLLGPMMSAASDHCSLEQRLPSGTTVNVSLPKFSSVPTIELTESIELSLPSVEIEKEGNISRLAKDTTSPISAVKSGADSLVLNLNADLDYELKLGERRFKPAQGLDTWIIPTQFIVPAGTKVSPTVEDRYILLAGVSVRTVEPTFAAKVRNLSGLAVREIPSKNVILTTDPEFRAPSGRVITLQANGNRAGFDDLEFRVCLQQDGGNKTWAITNDSMVVVRAGRDAAAFELLIPEELPLESPASTHVKIQLIGLADDGAVKVSGEVSLEVTSKTGGVIWALVVVALLVMTPKLLSKGRLDVACVFRGYSGRASVSQFQIWIWTVVVLGTMTYIWAVTGVFLDIPAEILGFLGISGGASVLAKGITVRSALVASPQTVVPLRHMKFVDLFTDENGFSLLRFQMLAFTLFALGYVVIGIWMTQAYPDIPQSIVLLMGVSNLTYVGGKAVDIQAKPTGTPLSSDEIKDIQAVLNVAETGVYDDATKAVVTAKRNEFGLPEDGGIDDAFLSSLLT